MDTGDSSERQRRITRLAHQVWESEGQPEGQALRHWRIAERLYEATLNPGADDHPGGPPAPDDCAANTPGRAT